MCIRHQVERYSRLAVVLGSCLLFIALLSGFRVALGWNATAASITFYIFVDIFSVILVEQFWSLANTVTDTASGRKSYWFIGTGGLLGGILGGVSAAALLESVALNISRSSRSASTTGVRARSM